LPSTLIRQTPPDQAEPAAEPDDSAEPAEGQSRADRGAAASPRPRKRRPAAPSEKTSKRGLYLTDAVWQRLQLAAVQRKTNVSAIAGDVLERNLPRLRIERDA
jgi:hypothetical protein